MKKQWSNNNGKVISNFSYIRPEITKLCTKCIQIRDFVKFHVEELNGEAYFDLP